MRSVPDGWNRNTYYHDRLLACLPADCRRVVDVGCGLGAFALRLARVAQHVDALDRNPDALAQAQWLSRDLPNVRFVEADFITWQPKAAYDAVSNERKTAMETLSAGRATSIAATRTGLSAGPRGRAQS